MDRFRDIDFEELAAFRVGKRNGGACFVEEHQRESCVVLSGVDVFVRSQDDGHILFVEGIKIKLLAFNGL